MLSCSIPFQQDILFLYFFSQHCSACLKNLIVNLYYRFAFNFIHIHCTLKKKSSKVAIHFSCFLNFGNLHEFDVGHILSCSLQCLMQFVSLNANDICVASITLSVNLVSWLTENKVWQSSLIINIITEFQHRIFSFCRGV